MEAIDTKECQVQLEARQTLSVQDRFVGNNVMLISAIHVYIAQGQLVLCMLRKMLDRTE